MTYTDIELHTKRKWFWLFTQWWVFHQSEISVFIKSDSNEVYGNVTERTDQRQPPVY